MPGLDPFTAYNAVLGCTAGVGLLYLLYLESFVVGYRRFVLVTTAGLLVFAVVGPLFEVFLPAYAHAVHGVAALLVVLGLYDPVRNDLRTDEWAALLLEDPARMRGVADWMVPMDDRILSLFHAADLVLTPAIVAYNLGHSRESVNRRLTELEAAGLVERVERGKYRIAPAGEQYLDGEVHASRLAGDDGHVGDGREAGPATDGGRD